MTETNPEEPTMLAEIATAESIIAEIEASLVRYEAIGWHEVHAEQTQELGWWKEHLQALRAAQAA